MSLDQVEEVQAAVIEVCTYVLGHPGAADREVRSAVKALETDGRTNGVQVSILDVGVDLLSRSAVPAMGEEFKAERKRKHALRIIDGLMDAVEIHSDTEEITVVMRKML